MFTSYINSDDDGASLEYTEKVIKALAHRSRLLIVQTIGRDEACVSDLQKAVGSDMSTISKHLLVLKNAGIVADRKVGLQVFYRLRIPCIADFVHCIGAVMVGRAPKLPAEILSLAKLEADNVSS